MPKRHHALIPLTHDHHHTLVQVQRLKQAARGDAPAMTRAADDFLNFYLGRARHHFREEEELFFAPLVDDEEAGPLVLKAVADHLRLHALARDLTRQLSAGEVGPASLSAVAELLQAHVRLEEQQLFPLVEAKLSEDLLAELATSGRRDV